MEFDRCGLDHFETSGKHLAQAVMDSKRTAILNDNMTELRKGSSFGKPEHFQRHLTDEPFRHRPGKIGKVGLGHLVIEGFVRDGGAPEGIEGAVEIGDGLDVLAGTGGRQREAQAKRGDGAHVVCQT